MLRNTIGQLITVVTIVVMTLLWRCTFELLSIFFSVVLNV